MPHDLRTIRELQADNGHVRGTDIAGRLGVGKAAVSLTLRSLLERGLVRHKHYQVVELTEAGAVEARRVMARFVILRRFLENVLEVVPDMATRDACLLEHDASAPTVDRLVDMIRFFEQTDAAGRPLAQPFREYHRACASGTACPACELQCDAARV